MLDERPVIEQVKSGFKIAGAILSSFAAFVLFLTGYSYIVGGGEQRSSALGWLLVMATTVTMFATVHFWAKWFCGIVSYGAVRATVLVFFAGRAGLSYWHAAGIAASLWFMAIVSIHFYGRRHFQPLTNSA